MLLICLSKLDTRTRTDIQTVEISGNLILMGGDDTSGAMWEDNFYFTTEIVGHVFSSFNLMIPARWVSQTSVHFMLKIEVL